MSEQINDTKKSIAARSGWVIVMIIALAAAVGQSFGRFSFGVLLPAIRDDLGITNTLAGLLGATNVGAYLLGTLAVAWATSRYRLINVMRVGLVLATLGLLIAGATKGPWVLAAGLFIAGIGGAFLWIPAPVIAADAMPAHRRPVAVAMMSSGIGLGIVFVSVLSGGLRSTQGDGAWSSVYQIQFAIGCVVMVAVFLLVRHHQANPTGGGGLGGFSALQRMQGWLPLILAYACFGFMYLLVVGFLTTRLEDDSGWTSANASWAFSLLGLSMIFGGPLFTTMAQLLGVRFALTLAFGLWPVFALVVLTGLTVPVWLACIGIGFLFSALPSLITLYVVENTTAEDYGASFAAATLVFGVAQMISPPIGGWIADADGSFTLVFLLSAVTALIGLVATLRLPRRAE